MSWLEEYNALLDKYPEERAEPWQILEAREIHACNDINIDDNAVLSNPEDGTGYWVSAWVWVDTFEDEDEAITSSCGHSPANCTC